MVAERAPHYLLVYIFSVPTSHATLISLPRVPFSFPASSGVHVFFFFCFIPRLQRWLWLRKPLAHALPVKIHGVLFAPTIFFFSFPLSLLPLLMLVWSTVWKIPLKRKNEKNLHISHILTFLHRRKYTHTHICALYFFSRLLFSSAICTLY